MGNKIKYNLKNVHEMCIRDSTYTFTGIDGKEEKIVLRPGENGVTEADIKTLHALDDSEVYYNNKNSKPERTSEEKAEIEEWIKKYVEEETARRGEAPSEYEIAYKVEERFPKNYNLSLEYDFGTDESDTDFDKNRLLYQLAVNPNCGNSEDTERVRELIGELTEKQREALQKVWFEGKTYTEASKEMKISVKNVSKHYNNALNYIKENFF